MKRANLAGKKRADGRWEIRVTSTLVSGGKTRKSFYGDTQKEAQEKAQLFIYEESRQPESSVRFSQLLRAYEESWEASGLKGSTIKGYQDSAKHVKLKTSGGLIEKLSFYETPADKITLSLLGVHLQTLQKSTHDHVRTFLTQVFNYGKRTGLCTQNPLAEVRIKRKAENKHARCSDQEFHAILPYIWEEHHPFFHFLAHVGLRPWKEGQVVDRLDIGRTADETFVIVRDSKTEAGKGRPVPITDRYLLDYIDSIESGPLFPGITYDGARQVWNRARKHASLEDVNIYGLRSLAITKWCEAGESLDVVMARAGHADPKTTLAIYNEVSLMRAVHGRGVNDGVKMSEFIRTSN